MLETEASVIGMIFLDESVLDDYRNVGVRQEWFGSEFFGEVFRVCSDLRNEDRRVDLVAVREKLGTRMNGDLMRLAAEVALSPALAETNALVLKKEFTSGKLSELLSVAQSEIMNEQDPYVIAGEVSERLEELVKNETGSVIKSTYQGTEKFLENWQKIKSGKRNYVKTGYSGLDRKLGGGMVRSGLYILAARPGGGKSALAVNISDRMANDGKTVLFVSLEMETEQLIARRLGLKTKLSFSQLMNHEFDEETEKMVLGKIPIICQNNIYYVDNPTLRVSDIIFFARRVKADVVIVDYLGLITPDDGRTLYEQTTKVSKKLKGAAKTLKVPILCLAQLNREVEGRGDGVPRSSDLRDSGQIEQDADGIMLLHRLSGNEPGVEATTLDILVTKNRHGAVGKVQTAWNLTNGEIVEVTGQYGNGPAF